MRKIKIWKNSKAIRLYAILAIMVITAFQGYWLYTVYESKKSIIIKESENILKTAVLNMDSKDMTDQLLNNDLPFTAELDDVTKELFRALKKNKDITVRMEVAGDTLNDSISQEILNKLSNKKAVLPKNQSRKVYTAIKEEMKVAFGNLNFCVRHSKNEYADVYPVDNSKAFDAKTDAIRSQMDAKQEYSLYFYNMKWIVFDEMIPSILLSIVYMIIYISAIFLLLLNVNKSRKLMEMKDNFTHNMTHEFKTPIATISLAIEALNKYDVLDDKEMTKEYLGLMKGDLDRLINMTDSILYNAKMSDGEMAMRFEKSNLSELVNRVEDHLKPILQKNQATVKVNYEDANLSIDADEEHFGNVFRNLIDNSIKYSKENPEITITISKERNFAKIVFSDNGIGIPDKYKNEIFKPYFRVLENDSYTTKGYGLGLNYIKQIINLHNGKIQLAGKAPKSGTTFEILIPLHHE